MPEHKLLVFGIQTGDNTYPHSGTFTVAELGQITVDDSDGVNDTTFDDDTDGGAVDVPDQLVTASTVTGINVNDVIDSRYTYTITGNDGSSGNIWFLATNETNNYGSLMVSDFVLDPSVTYTFGTFNRQGQQPYGDLVPCFTPGTLIDTDRGPRPVEDIAVGDRVLTVDAGPQPVRWVGTRALDRIDLAMAPNLRPIRISAGALGPGVPSRALTVSPQHRVLVRSAIAERMFGTREVLVAAVKLLALPGVSRCTGTDSVTYLHLMLDRHHILRANGTRTESLLAGPVALQALPDAARKELATLFPHLTEPGFTPDPARPIPRESKRARRLVERHARNKVALQ